MKRLVRFFAAIIVPLQLSVALLSTDLLANKSVRILAYGDSLTAGYRLPPAQSYPSQLAELFKKDGMNVEIINGGVSGDTSAQALARVEWSLKRGPFDLVVLCIGANDGLRQLAVQSFESNLRKLVQTFQDKNIAVAMVGMQLPTNFPPDYRKSFQGTYKKIAQEKKVPLYPFMLEGVAQNPKYNLEDSLHPNKDGYAIIAQKIQAFLKPLIKPNS